MPVLLVDFWRENSNFLAFRGIFQNSEIRGEALENKKRREIPTVLKIVLHRTLLSFLEFDYLSYIHNSVLMRGGGVGTASRAHDALLQCTQVYA